MKRSQTLKGKKHDLTWVNKISESLKGKPVSEATISASVTRHKNSVWYNDGIKEYMVACGSNVPDNYVKGRLKNPFPD